MKRNLANHLVRTIQDELLQSPQFALLESRAAKPLSGFHSFADGLPCLGAFLIGNGLAHKLWVLIIDWKKSENYYVVIYPENHNLPPVAELHNQQGRRESPDLSWSYKPSKRDGRNPERKETFLRSVGSLEFVVSAPGATVTLPCEICGFDFAKVYGTLGASYIEAHHTKPLSDLGEHETQETKLEDLAMVCANCHRMLHRKRPWTSIQQIKEFISDET